MKNACTRAGAFGANRPFRAQFGAPPRRRAPQQQQHHQQQQRAQHGGAAAAGGGSALLGLLQLLPVILLVAMTLFSGARDPDYSLQRDGAFLSPLATARLGVPFFVKSAPEFDRRFGLPGTRSRTAVERQIESEHYERAHLQCQQERMRQHRLYTWGSRQKAEAMATPGCDELAALNERLGGAAAAGGGGAGRQRAY